MRMSEAKILLLNAGSSSLKCTLMEAPQGKVIASAVTDWAGSATSGTWHRMARSTPKRKPGKDIGEAVRRVLHDLRHAEPVALPGVHLGGRRAPCGPRRPVHVRSADHARKSSADRCPGQTCTAAQPAELWQPWRRQKQSFLV